MYVMTMFIYKYIFQTLETSTILPLKYQSKHLIKIEKEADRKTENVRWKNIFSSIWTYNFEIKKKWNTLKK